MTERDHDYRYEPIEQEPDEMTGGRTFVYQGTVIEPAKSKNLMLKKGSKTVSVKQPRRRERAVVYITETDTLTLVPRAKSKRITATTPPISDFPQIGTRHHALQEVEAAQKPISPRGRGAALSTHYNVEPKAHKRHKLPKPYSTPAGTYWGPPSKDHPPVRKKLGKIKLPNKAK